MLGPRNFFNLHPFVTIRPTAVWSLTADMNFFWRLDTSDGVYAPAGQLIRGPSGSDERFVGSAFSLTSEYALTENLSFIAIYTHFFAGDFIRATGPSEDIDFFELTLPDVAARVRARVSDVGQVPSRSAEAEVRPAPGKISR